MSSTSFDNKSYLIGSNIKKAREEAGFTQAKLGEKIGGYSSMAISYFEKGEREIKSDILSKIAEVLSKDIQYFFETNENQTQTVSAFFRRGNYDLSQEERKKEDDAVKDFRSLVIKQFNEESK